MNITATITGNCRFMSLVVSGDQGLTYVNIANGTDMYQVEVVLPAGNAAANTVISLEDTIGVTNGIFELSGIDSGGNVAYAGAFSHCDLDCCIAGKVDSLLGCDCSCTKCNSKLLQAERVMLLTVGIETDLANIGGDNAVNIAIFERARAKYSKAQELCADSCGCNC